MVSSDLSLVQSTLADSLEVILPSFPPALASPGALPHLRRLAQTLAPIPHCGFEVPLMDSTRVDLQQCIMAHEGEPQQLRSHLRAQLERSEVSTAMLDASWRRVDDFLAQWSEPTSAFHESIADLWLEFDQDTELTHAFPPALFFGFHRKQYAAPDHFSRFHVAQEALDVLLGSSSWMSYQANLEKCFAGCRSQAFVSHIGVMPGRRLPALRINTKCLAPEALNEYLHEVGWPGALDEAVKMMSRLYSFVDRITVCLDVGDMVYPQIGFECILDEQPPVESRWAMFLDYLVEQGWCLPAKREALLAWPGWTGPTTVTGRWPDHLVHHSLVHSPDRFTTLVRRLSHIKIVCQPRQKPEAKAYFGFLHGWLRTEIHKDAKLLPQVEIKEPTKPFQIGQQFLARPLAVDEFRIATRRAVAFLLDARNEADWWYDYPNVKCGSDGWITGFVGSMLSTVPDQQGQEAVRQAWLLLNKRKPQLGGWGYSIWVPADADTTTWGLRLAAAVGEEGSERAQQARRILEEHILPNGGLPSYREKVLRPPVGMLGRLHYGSVAGWCGTAHACITAAAAVLDDRPLNFLRRTQSGDGSWKAYWWDDAEYSTALAAEALARTGRATDRKHVELAVDWAVGRIGRSGGVYSRCHGEESAFATGWCVLILTLAEDPARVWWPLERALRWLLDAQQRNGAWPASAWLRFPFPDNVDPEIERSAVFLDELAVFTSATVVSALEAGRSYLSRYAGGQNGSFVRSNE